MDLTGILEKLMSSNDTAQLIEKLKASVENTEAAPPDSSKTEEKKEQIQLTETFPDAAQITEKLPQVMAALSPLMENGSIGKTSHKGSVECRNNLLVALRPYLNDGRRGMIDKIMALSKFTGIMDMLPRNK